MTPQTFLMCPPDYYTVAYEINPWMSVKRKVDHPKAVRQWTAYYELLTRELKARVECLAPVKGLPDLVFTANAGLVRKRIFIRSNFRFRERQREEPVYEKWFKKKGYLVKKVERPHAFEGEGDALFLGRELFTGYHFRSDVEAHDAVAGILKIPYFALQLCDKRFYHLDTCFAPVSEKSAVIYMKAFEPYAQLVLLESVPDPIQVPEKEALKFACNLVAVGGDIIIPEGCPETTKELKKRKFRVHPLDFSEFLKAGGATKCLALKV